MLVRSQPIKDELSEGAMLGIGNQHRVRDASVTAVFLADLEPTKRINRIYELERGHRNVNYRSSFPLSTSFWIGEGHVATLIKDVTTSWLRAVRQPMPEIEPVQAWSYKNTSLVAQTFVYGAQSYNLSTAMMEGYDPRRVKDILRIPDRYAIPLMVATGYEYEGEEENYKEDKTLRLGLSEIVFDDEFGQEWNPGS